MQSAARDIDEYPPELRGETTQEGHGSDQGGSGHDIQREQPELVLHAIRDVVWPCGRATWCPTDKRFGWGFRRVIGQDTWGASLRRRQALRLVFCPSPVPARARGGG
jgi:hypothetical protein